MGFLCGKKCECKRRCKSYFPGIPTLEDACKKACSDNKNLDRDTFLCSGRYVDQRTVILGLHYDPCLGDNIGFEDTVSGQIAGENERTWERLRPVFLVLALLLIAAMAIIYVIRK